MRKIIQTLYNLIIEIAACIMKIGVILSMPVMFVYFIFNPKKV